ncbi:pyridoxal-dependent decarboxylase, exosortase A system-associated [Sphingomonas sp. SUN039]|uniref:pyridoxal-dependent decarboxylase, exosortase A system-associated n=1 Tax=Sphingomonas sp. SUN039 TaxID=2937787 RepID=UPI0021646911|nr:pyridoxal-dependent decarboxylase, exosortase A system-associated [Sphingomonas sp. SUN039]UVO53291.1 pyridoxal-dependent decarboxylase, exosortase A system-associated [Sphingomonas sp. SUN039]
MKPFGTIPPWWDAARMDRALAASSVATPCFVYDLDIVRDKVATLRAALPPGVGIHYAVKANPLPGIIAALAALVDGLDIASAGELALVESAAPHAHVSFAGPGKRDSEIEAAIRAGVTLNLESEGEADRALAIASRLGIAPKLAVRVNPDFSLKGSGMKMGGGAAAFGIDAERVAPLVRRLIQTGADWRGFHIFAGSQALDSEAIAATQAATVELAGRLAEEAGATPPLVNLGGGFGIPYFANDATVDVTFVGARLGDALAARADSLKTSRFAIELGRWLVGECGVYLSRVIDRKESRGETFLVTDGGLHHQLAASGNFGTVVRRNYPIAVATRFAEPPSEIVNIVGCLCTPLDKLGDSVSMPRADVGDVIAVFMAGAYGASASPAAFLGHGPAPEHIIGAAD